MNPPIIHWHTLPVQQASIGVVVGCNRAGEWLLPWWWMNFSLYNLCPITVVNFGDMSLEALKWCKGRVNIQNLMGDDSFILDKKDIAPRVAKEWETRRSNIWFLRKAWFKIPFALLMSPYEKTVWLDLDCQVTGSIAPLFTALEKADFAIAPESESQQEQYLAQGDLLPKEIIYNAGVICYRHGCKLVEEWAAKALYDNGHSMGCQKLLAGLLMQQPKNFIALSPLYNWALADGENKKAIILHHWGAYQIQLRKHIAFLKNKLLINLSFDEC